MWFCNGKFKYYVGFFIILFYLFYNTGLHSDDYSFLRYYLEKGFTLEGVYLFGSPVFFTSFPAYIVDFFIFQLGQYNDFVYSIIKALASYFVIYAVYKFINDYVSADKAILFALLFYFFPTHDAGISYHVVGSYISITLALVLLSHNQITSNNYKSGILLGLLGAFYSHASPAFGFGLSLIFLLKKEYNKFLLFVLPYILYISYYFIMTYSFSIERHRIIELSLNGFLRNLLIQIITALDTFVGPSFILKVIYSITELSVVTFFLGLVIIYIFIKYYKFTIEKVDYTLLFSLAFVMLLSWMQFSLTGAFPQIAFNLGNRVTIYGSFFISLVIIYLIQFKKYVVIIAATIFLFTALGISDHWKDWNSIQKNILHNISENKELERLVEDETLFVSHNQYSRLGKMSHIEFFSQDWVVDEFFNLALGRSLSVSPINKRFIVRNDLVVDKKYGSQYMIIDHITVYNSTSNTLHRIQKDDIQKYIDDLPHDHRHWSQLLKDNKLKSFIIKLAPRLDYLY